MTRIRQTEGGCFFKSDRVFGFFSDNKKMHPLT